MYDPGLDISRQAEIVEDFKNDLRKAINVRSVLNVWKPTIGRGIG